MILMHHEIRILQNYTHSCASCYFYSTCIYTIERPNCGPESSNLSYKYRSTLKKPITRWSLMTCQFCLAHFGLQMWVRACPLSLSTWPGFPSTISRSTFKRRIPSQLFLHPSPRVIIAWKMEAWNSGKNTTSA